MARSTSIADRLIAALDRFGVKEGKLLVAVSGGLDSMALIDLLKVAAPPLQLELVVAHFNHKLRGAASDSDQQFVEEYCINANLPIRLGGAAVREMASLNRSNLEAAARLARYRWLATQAQEAAARWLATAHHADDQAETVLHHLFRGTHLRGLRGIAARRKTGEGIVLIRPLLGVTRRELEAYMRANGLCFRDDRTNQDVSFTRNWLRHAILGPLKERYGDQVIRRVSALAREAGRNHRRGVRQARRLLAQAERPRVGNTVILDATVLRDHRFEIVAEAFILLWRRENWPRSAMTRLHWERLVGLLMYSKTSADFPGRIRAERRGSVLRIALTG